MLGILLTILLFEPIIIDEQTYSNILQSARQNFRVSEYEMLTQMLGNLEQRANAAKQHETPVNPPETKK